MSDLKDNPDLIMEALAKCVHKLGGYVKITGADVPAGPFNLASRIDWATGTIELRLFDGDGETQ